MVYVHHILRQRYVTDRFDSTHIDTPTQARPTCTLHTEWLVPGADACPIYSVIQIFRAESKHSQQKLIMGGPKAVEVLDTKRPKEGFSELESVFFPDQEVFHRIHQDN